MDPEGRILTGNWHDPEDFDYVIHPKRQPEEGGQRVDDEFVQTPAFAGFAGNSFYQVDSLVKPQITNSLIEDHIDKDGLNLEASFHRVGKS